MPELPPPPPPPSGPGHPRCTGARTAPRRPDRETLLADRTRALEELTRRSVGPVRLLLLLLVVAGCELAWALLSTALISLDDTVDGFTVIFAVVTCLLALLALVPSVAALVVGVRRDRAVRALLRQWAAVAVDPAGDTRHQRTGSVVSWLLVSLALTTGGLWLTTLAPASADPARDTGRTTYSLFAFALGTGLILCAAGVLGLIKAIDHHRWAAGLLTVVPARERGGAHR
ncbi:hypothetical protein ACIBCM_19765 [Streptomyces sp. NPDC051018]|uniref:hypothetical protein n=1 Tax=Streptomyces sp. NPDC051018 TaxID=3365639 RepID=UPI00378D1056